MHTHYGFLLWRKQVPWRENKTVGIFLSQKYSVRHLWNIHNNVCERNQTSKVKGHNAHLVSSKYSVPLNLPTY